MKKTLLMMVAVLTLAVPSQAQVKFGLKGGLNLTNISFDKSVGDNIKNQTGFHIGPTVKLTLPVVGLSFDAAALYDQRSAKADAAGKTLKAQSLQVPINVRYGVGLGSVANIFAFAGPQFGFNIGSKNQSIVDNQAQWSLKSSNLSANFGLGATLLSHLQVTMSYNVALGTTGEVEVLDAAKKIIGTNAGKANAWQVSAAYFF